MNRKRKSPKLDRSAIIDGAVALASTGGLESLSMRKLAGHLDVQAMSLYWYFDSRDAILDAVTDRIYSLFYQPVPGMPWRQQLEKRSRSIMNILSEHPWSIPLLSNRRQPGAATLSHLDGLLGCLMMDGFSSAQAAHAAALVDAHVYGFAIQASSLPFSSQTETDRDDPTSSRGTPGTDGKDSAADVVQEMASLFADGAFPYLAQFVDEHVMTANYNFMDEFEWSLQAVLDAAGALLIPHGK